ncbi:peptidase family C50-domain-containing protein [Phycomyces nitens]|nr:peptidase family C50-domain-containing protein [Phycomyces nitens]
MTAAHERLLAQLNDLKCCGPKLTATMRTLILDPFKPDLNRPESLCRAAQPTRNEFMKLSNEISPIAIQIINQNLKTLDAAKSMPVDDRTAAVYCLIDTFLYAIAALRCMGNCSSLKPLDLEKALSNLIGKMITIGEYAWALDELRKLRSVLDQFARPLLVDKTTQKSGHQQQGKGSLTPSLPNQRKNSTPKPTPGPFGTLDRYSDQISDQDMVQLYGEMTFPLDTGISDTSMVLLILAYQLSFIRVWCNIRQGSLLKYLPDLLAQPGNLFEWIQHLSTIEPAIAKKQFDALHKILLRASKTVNPSTKDSDMLIYRLQTYSWKALARTGTMSIVSICDQILRSSIALERSSKQNNYSTILACYADFVPEIVPNTKDDAEVNSYLIMTEYYGYLARKANDSKAEYTAFQSMAKPLYGSLKQPSKAPFFKVAYGASAELAMLSTTIDRILQTDQYTTLGFENAISYIKPLLTCQKPTGPYDSRAIGSLCKTIDSFQQSCQKFFDHVKRQKSSKTESTMPPPSTFSSPGGPSSSMPRTQTRSVLGLEGWRQAFPSMMTMLEQASKFLVRSVQWIQSDKRPPVVPEKVYLAFVDTMVLLAKMHMLIHKDVEAAQRVYIYLKRAEDLCLDQKHIDGLYWTSLGYRDIGIDFATRQAYKEAIYPLRKSCTLLEKQQEKKPSDTDAFQLCKRYDTLGVCCQKSGQYEQAAQAFRQALMRFPVSSIKSFVSQASSTPISTIVYKNPLIPKTMDRFLRCSAVDMNMLDVQLASNALDLSQLTPLESCIVYECELAILQALMVKRDVSLLQESVFDILLSVYRPETCPIRRTRVLVEKVQLERIKHSLGRSELSSAMECAIEASRLLQSKSYGEDSNLLNYRRHYMAMADSWIAICSYEMGEDPPCAYEPCISQWGKLLKDIQPKHNGDTLPDAVKRIQGCIDNVDRLYSHLQMLSNTFSLNYQLVFHANILSLLKKLANGLRSSTTEDVSDTVLLSATLGRTWSDMGYSGKASIEFACTQEMVKDQQCNSTAVTTYYMYLAHHKAHIGQYKESKVAFDIAKKASKPTLSPTTGQPLRNVRLQVAKTLELADAYYVCSFIGSHTDTLEYAILDAMDAFRILSKCANTFKAEAAQRAYPNSNQLEDPFSDNTSASRHTTGSIMSAADIAFKESEWCIAQRMGVCLLHLGNIHGKHGTWREALYFLQQGQLLGEQIKSEAMIYKFSLGLTELHIRCGTFEDNRQFIETAAGLLNVEEDPYLKHKLDLQMMVGYAMSNAETNIEDSLSAYAMASQTVMELTDRVFIIDLEKLIEPDTIYEEHFKRANSKDKEFQCIPLLNKDGLNTIHREMAMFEKDMALGAALDSLDRLENEKVMVTEKYELDSAFAKVWKELVRSQVDSIGTSILSRVLALPNSGFTPKKVQTVSSASKRSMVQQVYSEKPAKDQPINQIREMLKSHLGELVKSHHKNFSIGGLGALRLMYESAGPLTFLKGCLSENKNRLASEIGQSAYIFEMVKGLKLRREMKLCMSAKLQDLRDTDGPSEPHWPADRTAPALPLKRRRRNSNHGNTCTVDPTLSSASAVASLTDHLSAQQQFYDHELNLEGAAFQANFVDILPPHWTAVSINLDPATNELYVIHLKAREPPLVVKIPLCRTRIHKTRTQKEHMSFEDASLELRDIIAKSDETIFVRNDRSTKTQVNTWWSERTLLDERLRCLLERIENEWFGGFKGLLCGNHESNQPELTRFKDTLVKAVYEVARKSQGVGSPSVCETLDIELSVCRMILKLGPSPQERDVEDVIQLLLGDYESQGAVIKYASIDVSILKNKIMSMITKYHTASRRAGVDPSKELADEHTILILDQYTNQFPFESMPVLRTRAVSRLPSLVLLRDRIMANRHLSGADESWSELGINASNTYYVLNPSGDLKHTQSEFEVTFQRMFGWDGLVEERPMEQELERALKTRDLFMYFGHSAGQSFIRGQRIRNLPRCAVALLMGCSSGSLDKKNEYDPDGYVLHYLLGGSPTVVATLWDVTDKSLDKLTKQMLEEWGILPNTGEKTSLVKAVASSRAHSNLTYLIGASVVVYGIPCYVKS